MEERRYMARAKEKCREIDVRRKNICKRSVYRERGRVKHRDEKE